MALFYQFRQIHLSRTEIPVVVHHYKFIPLKNGCKPKKLKIPTYLNIPGDSSPPLATPGSDVSLRSDIDDTFLLD